MNVFLSFTPAFTRCLWTDHTSSETSDPRIYALCSSLRQLVHARKPRLQVLVRRDVRTGLDALLLHTCEVVWIGKRVVSFASRERRANCGRAHWEIEVTSTQVLSEAEEVGWKKNAMENRSGMPSSGIGEGRTTR